MHKNTKIFHPYSDALLLASIAIKPNGEPSNLRDIFAAGDFLQHAIFDFEEIESGLVRLTQARWVKELPNQRFSVTNKFKKFNIKITNISHVHKLAKFMGALAWGNDQPHPYYANNLKYPGINRRMLKMAEKKYLDSN